MKVEFINGWIHAYALDMEPTQKLYYECKNLYEGMWALAWYDSRAREQNIFEVYVCVCVCVCAGVYYNLKW